MKTSSATAFAASILSCVAANGQRQTATPRRLWTPPAALVANNWEATTPGGISVKLVGITDSLVGNLGQVWTPDGTPIENPEPQGGHFGLRKTIADVRRLFLEIDGGRSSPGMRTGAPPSPESQMVFAFIPGIAEAKSDPKSPNGWPGIGLTGRPSSWLAQNANTPIYVVSNRMKVSDLVLGISDGPFQSIDSFPNTLSTAIVGKTLGRRTWGTAKVIDSPTIFNETRPTFAELIIESKTVPPTDQIVVTGFDAGGKAITNSAGNHILVVPSRLPFVKRWEVKARPFHYVVFKGVHFDEN